jgi:hypothetical protein
MHALDAMDQEPKCEPPFLDWLTLILYDQPELVDPADHAALV